MAPWALPFLPRAACCVRQQGQASPLQREADVKLGFMTSKDDGFAAAWDILGEIKKINSSMREMLHRWCMYAEKGALARGRRGAARPTSSLNHRAPAASRVPPAMGW